MKNKFIKAGVFLAGHSKSKDLYRNLWHENTTSLLHAPRGAGKTAMALDIAVSLTTGGDEVFYLTTGRIDESLHRKIAGNTRLYIHSPQFASPDDPADYADIVIADIEEAIAVTQARIFIIDSLSRIAALSFGRNASPAYIMKRLVALQMRYGISLLVVTRDGTRAAMRSLLNLADSEIIAGLPEKEAALPADSPSAHAASRNESSSGSSRAAGSPFVSECVPDSKHQVVGKVKVA